MWGLVGIKRRHAMHGDGFVFLVWQPAASPTVGGAKSMQSTLLQVQVSINTFLAFFSFAFFFSFSIYLFQPCRCTCQSSALASSFAPEVLFALLTVIVP
ncbi:hypothetical protein GGI43DRAFT_418609 [Trichoderma evansii]